MCLKKRSYVDSAGTGVEGPWYKHASVPEMLRGFAFLGYPVCFSEAFASVRGVDRVTHVDSEPPVVLVVSNPSELDAFSA